MRIKGIKLSNYRTFENIDLRIPAYYTAICGKNDSGKTNVVRAIRNIIREDYFPWSDNQSLSSNDYPKWKDDNEKEPIRIELNLEIDSSKDSGLFNFINTYLSLDHKETQLNIILVFSYSFKTERQDVEVTIEDDTYKDSKAQEILTRLQSSKIILFHNSTDPDSVRHYEGGRIRDFSSDHSDQLEQIRKTISRKLKKIATNEQREVEELLGRLERKYKVGITVPNLDLSFIPYSITLGDSKIDVKLQE